MEVGDVRAPRSYPQRWLLLFPYVTSYVEISTLLFFLLLCLQFGRVWLKLESVDT